MKKRITVIAFLCCLLYLPFNVKADEWCGTTANGKFQWKIETLAAEFKVTVHPLTLTGSGFINIYPSFGGGYGLLKDDITGDWTGLTPRGGITDGNAFTFHFLYNGDGIVGQEQTETFTYAAGDVCGTTPPNTLPTVSLTAPNASDSFTSPATVNFSATANDSDGTIAKVEFYSGSNKIGESSSTNPYIFSWTNVQPGTYTLTAKAIDNKGGSTISTPVTITVGGNFTVEWCGQSAGNAVPSTGDEFQWKAETDGSGKVTITFRGIGAAAGCDFAIVNGNLMAYDAASGNLTFAMNNQIAGTELDLKFTYRRGTQANNTGENNNNGNPVKYTVGQVCSAPLPVSLISFDSKLANNGSVNLTWATSAEHNNSHFLVERSADGKNFTTLQKVDSKNGNSQARLDYQYTDRIPLAGNNYYRLTQIDLNGDSKIVGYTNQNVALATTTVSLSPNPLAGNRLTINLGNSKVSTAKVTITTVAGATVYSQTVAVNNGVAQVNLNSKPSSGIYLVKVGELAVQKLIIK